MPEEPEVKIFWRRLLAWIQREFERTGRNPLAHLLIFPRVFAEGTARRSYCTTTVESLNGYTTDLETPDESYIPNTYDCQRSVKKPWERLIQTPLRAGPIYTAVRGKSLVIAAGHHAVSFNFGLEANLILMSPADFRAIIRNDGPGPNSDRRKAQRLRSFRLPPHLIEQGSSSKPRLINIFAAFVCESQVIVICDFARLIRMHIISSPHIWEPSDLAVGSKYWSRFWAPFPDGPDWTLEPEAAALALDAWRVSVIARETCYARSMVDTIGSNQSLAFGGFGRHLANDFLYLIAIFPGTPAYVVCDDEDLYATLKQAIPPYMAQWSSLNFFRSCGGSTNSLNPFAFNTTSNRNYTSAHIHVFRRLEAKVPALLFDKYQHLGLLDGNHVIGTQYNGPIQPCTTEYKWVPVQYHGTPLDSFTIVTAQRPTGYIDGKIETFKDITRVGFPTSIGPSQFRESKQNMHDISVAPTVCTKVGRPRKMVTGRAGRPRKTPTKASLQKQHTAAVKRRFVSVKKPPGNKENVALMEIDGIDKVTLKGRITRSRSRKHV